MGFRDDFLWGAASSSYQVEGAWDEGGKGRSVWDDFAHETGNIHFGHTGDVACDHYHRFRDDVALLKMLGIPNYRFSISWPRLFPEGRGALNEEGADFYDRLLDALLEAGIFPCATLFHWDYPAALDDRGAWRNPDSPRWFADYAACCARRYGDRVKAFVTINEPQCFIGLGYHTGEHAPGQKLPLRHVIAMSHRVLLAHGLAALALRAEAPGARVGYAPCGDVALPQSDSPEDVGAARRAYFDVRPEAGMFVTSWWSDPPMLGRYPERGLALYEQFLPAGWQADLETICQPLDFYGQNIYNGRAVRADGDGYAYVEDAPGSARTALGWTVAPEALYWGPRFLYERYRTPIVITENGMSGLDAVSLDGDVHDPQRIDYLRRYLRCFRRAADDGVDALGYFHWSFLDNLEWSQGYSERFGLVHVDYRTQKRTPKDSAAWYRRVIETNGREL